MFFDFGILDEINEVSTAFRILLAVLLGGGIGFERGKHGRAAGLRTHVLVCVGAALASMTGSFLTSTTNMGDPTRIASCVLSGIGFLGAGMILVKNNSRVTGLTTAAALWATASVGLAVGAGYYVGGLLAAAVIFLTTTLLTVFEVKQKRDIVFYVELDDHSKAADVVGAIRKKYPAAHNFDLFPPKSGVAGHIGLSVNINTQNETTEEVEREVGKIEHVVISVMN